MNDKTTPARTAKGMGNTRCHARMGNGPNARPAKALASVFGTKQVHPWTQLNSKMEDSIEYCETCQSNVWCYLNRGCQRLDRLCPSDATACSVAVDLTEAESTALDELCAQKDMTRQGVMIAALRLYQAVALGAAEVTHKQIGIIGCAGD